MRSIKRTDRIIYEENFEGKKGAYYTLYNLFLVLETH